LALEYLDNPPHEYDRVLFSACLGLSAGPCNTDDTTDANTEDTTDANTDANANTEDTTDANTDANANTNTITLQRFLGNQSQYIIIIATTTSDWHGMAYCHD
jgi:hypothetical protein